MSQRLLSRLAALAFLLAPCACDGPPAPATPPNVVLFLVDDMGWMDSSAYGSRYYETPNMERLAREGMRFTDAYAAPVCSPTRASLLTGKHSARHGITNASGHQAAASSRLPQVSKRAQARRRVILPPSRTHLEASEYTLAEALRDAGYRTGHFGKWHLGLQEAHWPSRHGFDVALHGVPDPGPASYFSPYAFAYQSFPNGPPGEYITDRLTDEALRFLAENRERPFLLQLSHYGVHSPWGHKVEYTRAFAEKVDPTGRQGNPIMASMLKSIDQSLGRVLDRIRELGIAERTIVIFYSDNGGNTRRNAAGDPRRAGIGPGHPRYAMLEDWRRWARGLPPTNNAPLRDGKGRLYEGGIRVPLMVSWPGVVPPGSTSAAVVGPIDFYPTLLDLLGIARPAQQALDGESFAGVLRGSGALRREAYFTWVPHVAPGAAVRQGDWKLIRRFEPTPEYPKGFELFDLRHDLGETRNLADAMPEKVEALDRLIDAFLRDTGARLPEPNPAYPDPAEPGS